MSVIIISAVVVLLLIIFNIHIFNKMVVLRNHREQAFADIDVQLQQRYDLIPSLVSVVSASAKHELETLTQVIAARNLGKQAVTLDEKVGAANTMSSLLRDLNVQIERYPELKANADFQYLQVELGDIENKLAAVRRFFNSTTKEYNTALEVFPNNLMASLFGFKRGTMFDLGSERNAVSQRPQIN